MRRVSVISKLYKGAGQYEVTHRGEAFFHQFGVEFEECETGFGNVTTAVIEWPDGKVEMVHPSLITFTEPLKELSA